MDVTDSPGLHGDGHAEGTAPQETLTRGIDEAMLIVSDGIIQYANSAGGRMFGVASASDLIGRKHLSFVHTAFHQSVLEGRAALEAGENPPARERMIVRADGKPLWVEVSACRLAVEGGPALLLMKDISERKAVGA